MDLEEKQLWKDFNESQARSKKLYNSMQGNLDDVLNILDKAKKETPKRIEALVNSNKRSYFFGLINI